MLNSDVKFEVNPAVVHREIEGQVLLMLPGQHDLFTLNDTGKLVWQALVERRPFQEIINSVAHKYGISSARVSDDIQILIDDLLDKGVIEKIN